MESPVQLVYFGEVLRGFEPDAVQREVARLLKLDDRRAARLFAGKRTVLKRRLAREDAERYARRLAKLGALVHIEPMSEAAAAGRAPAAGRRATATVGARRRRLVLLTALAGLGASAAVVAVLMLRPGAERVQGVPVLTPELETTAKGLLPDAQLPFRAYTAAPAHKAFAVSAGGGWGWRGNSASIDEAMDRALAECNAKRPPNAAPCDVIDTH
ncbi:hypothetical protein [Piscinibacter sp. XHJ-5]|uniref:hypothetical protein n=1 Tax=Piscinibacter sp. XHJ-5 TaxID=3037797 RepID=UPI0024534B34|nr:hypothetical protein [Piscinibacter sp. XHJ-5]